MAETGTGDYFIFQDQDGPDDDAPLIEPAQAEAPAAPAAPAAAQPTGQPGPAAPAQTPPSLVTPGAPPPAPAPAQVAPPQQAAEQPAVPAQPTQPAPAAAVPAPAQPAAVAATAQPAAPAPAAAQPVASAPAHEPTKSVDARVERLHGALEDLIAGSPDVEAAAVISLDGFTMASALPASMQEDRVGAMSAAILALGERASRELGKGKLTQVFIEGDGGYVMLMAAGSTAVLTCMASEDAKLGLVIYDMRRTAAAVGEIVG